jgi:hypothetical protein
VVSFNNLRPQVELRVDNALRKFRREAPLTQQASFLDGAGAGHDCGSITVRFRLSFEQKRDIYKEPGFISTVLVCESRPRGADARMENCFQGATLAFVLEDHSAQKQSIGPAGCLEYIVPKSLAHLVVNP